jgi:hypothetical protein
LAENEEKLVKKEMSVASMYNTKLKLKGNQLAVAGVRSPYFEKVEKVAKEVSVANMCNTKLKPKLKLKDSQLVVIRVRFSYFEKIAKETPTEEVGQVDAVAMTLKPVPEPAAQPRTPAKQALVQSDTPAQPPNAAIPAQPTKAPASAPQHQTSSTLVSRPDHSQLIS